MRNRPQTKSTIYAKSTSPSYHTRPSVRLEKPIFFDFPIDNLKYSTGPRMKHQAKFQSMKSVPQKQKELVYDPFYPPRSSKLPILNSYKSDPNVNLNLQRDHKNPDQKNNLGDFKQKEICEPPTLPSNQNRSRRFSLIQQSSRLSSQVKIHNMQSFGIGLGSDTSLGISKASSNITLPKDDNNNNTDQAAANNNNENDLIFTNHVLSQSNNRFMVFSGDFECGNLGYVYRTGQCEYEINILPDPSRNYSAHWYFFKVENIPPGTYTFTITGIFRNLNLHDIGVLPVALSMNSIQNYTNKPNSKIDPKLNSSHLDLPGWQRYGPNLNFCCVKRSPLRYALTFSFSVGPHESDSIYFAYLYPYTYSQLTNFLKRKLPPNIVPSTLCKTPGGIDYPAIFWDADLQQCVDVGAILNSSTHAVLGNKYVLNYKSSKGRLFTSSKSATNSSSSSSRTTKTPTSTRTSSSVPKKNIKPSVNDGNHLLSLMRTSSGGKKPLIVFTARHHPGETCASYAMEAFIDTLFCHIEQDLDGVEDINEKRVYNEARRLLRLFSFLILPMMNIDGVVCGYFRHSLGGYDMNRSWIRPSSKIYPVEATVIRLIDKLVQTRPLLFFLDFHGHSSQCNAFTYSVWNDDVPFNEYEAIFPQLMSQNTDLFDDENSISLVKDAYTKTMRVALHHRYRIPFAYTLEMSYGGMDAGSRRGTQFSQGGYREIGHASVKSLAEMLIDQIPMDMVTRNYVPPVKDPQ